MPTTDAAVQYYDADYFAWQRPIGEFAAKAIRFMFAPYIKPTDNVADFGCGGGYLLAAMDCADRRGIEVNPVARAEAEHNGIRTVSSPSELPDEWADVVISNSALEHCENPLAEVRSLLPKVKHGGKVVLGIWVETVQWEYKPNDINQHLYTWSPMAFGNLVTTAGFTVKSVDIHRTMWPPRIYMQLYSLVGDSAFRAICRAYRFARVALSPVWPVHMTAGVIVIAERP